MELLSAVPMSNVWSRMFVCIITCGVECAVHHIDLRCLMSFTLSPAIVCSHPKLGNSLSGEGTYKGIEGGPSTDGVESCL